MTRTARVRRVAVFVSGHGFGHLTRTSAILAALVARRPVRLTVVTAAPRALWPKELAPHTDQWIATPCDAGVVQRDDLRVDVPATHAAVAVWTKESAQVRDRLTRSLGEGGGIDCVVGDVPPMAFDIAAALAVPSVAVANFSWDWIYARMGLEHAAEAARCAYERASLLLELTPAAPMPAFPRRISMGVVGRRASRDRSEIRNALGLAPEDRCVLLALRPPLLDRVLLPPREDGLRYLSPTPLAGSRSDVASLPANLGFLDALSASNAVLAKSGYGILGDCAANGALLAWARRDGFPEDPVLADWLGRQTWALEVPTEALWSGDWRTALATLSSRATAPAVVPDTAAMAADEVSRLLD